jgi:hypothetical protein
MKGIIGFLTLYSAAGAAFCGVFALIFVIFGLTEEDPAAYMQAAVLGLLCWLLVILHKWAWKKHKE